MTSVAATQFAWRLVAGGLAIGAALVVSTMLGLSTQGVIAASVAVLAGLSVATGTGFTHAVAFAVARRPSAAGRVVDHAAVLAIASSSAAGVLVAALASITLASVPVLWWHVAIALPFFQLGQLGLGLQQGLGSSRGYATTYVSQPFTAFCLAILAAAAGGRSEVPSEWSGPLIVVPFVVQAATLIGPWRALPRAQVSEPVRMMLSYTARIYPSAVAHFLSYRLDLILVSTLLGATAAGVYSLALNGVDAVARIGQTAATVLFPRFVVIPTSQGARSLARRAALVAGALSLAVSAVLAGAVLAFGQQYGPEVRTIGVLLAVLAVGGGSVSAWGVLASFLAARDRLGATARVNAVLLCSSVIIYGALIPVIGVYGGAIGTSSGLLLAALLGYWEAGRESG